MIDWEKVDNTTEEEIALQKLEDDMTAGFEAFEVSSNSTISELLDVLWARRKASMDERDEVIEAACIAYDHAVSEQDPAGLCDHDAADEIAMRAALAAADKARTQRY